MGATKNHIHTESQIQLARLFKALGHPARIAIIENLLIHDDLNCNGLRTYIQLASSTISAHIKELHDAGVLGVRVIGNNAYYVLNKFAFESMTNYLDQVFERIDTHKKERLFIYVRPQPDIPVIHFKNSS